MKRAFVLILTGVIGILSSASSILWAQLAGPCWPFEVGACWCVKDNGNNYWYYCADHQKNNASCQDSQGPCDIVNPAKCYTNMSTVRMRCDSDSSCTMNCYSIGQQCTTMGPLCPSQL